MYLRTGPGLDIDLADEISGFPPVRSKKTYLPLIIRKHDLVVKCGDLRGKVLPHETLC